MKSYVGVEEVIRYRAFILINNNKIYVGDCSTAKAAAQLHDYYHKEHTGEQDLTNQEMRDLND